MKRILYFTTAAAILFALNACNNAYKPHLNFEQSVNHSDNQAVAYYIAKGNDVNQKNAEGVPFIVIAAYQKDPQITQKLIQAGADVNVKVEDNTLANFYFDDAADKPTNPVKLEGFTPLIVASAQGNLENVKALIAAGADINAVSAKGISALIAASGQGHLEIVKTLLEAGANKNQETQFGFTALKAAEQGKYTQIADLLK